MVDLRKTPPVPMPLPQEAWPVTAKGLLTKREGLLYQLLHRLYPDHRLFVQVALSQLVDVPRHYPKRRSIRNRFSQLVADFVLCRSDLSIVAVIELDDRTHLLPWRQAADARKTKALTDAGLRLIRIPAGPLPTADALREKINSSGPPSDLHVNSAGGCPQGPLALDLYLTEDSRHGFVEPPNVIARGVNSHSVRGTLFGTALACAVFAGGWYVYARAWSHISRPTPSSLERTSAASAHTSKDKPAASFTQVIVGRRLTPQELEARQRAEALSAAEKKRSKDRAWAAYYVAPASCQHPVDWSAQVECGNQYMRAKRTFEQEWFSSHEPNNPSPPEVVLE